MKFTLGWLKEFLDTNASLEEIVNNLTRIGLEVEKFQDQNKILESFKAVEIIECRKHENATNLSICLVNDGTQELEIICGAPNVRKNLKTILAPVGSIIPSNNIKIKKSKIRGITSNGMLCSAAELNINDESNKIIEIDQHILAGTPLTELSSLIGEKDPIIEIAITPNRGDCLSVYGIARDLSATGLGILKPLTPIDEKIITDTIINIEILSNYCTKFSGRVITNIQNQESPKWLQNHLKNIGLTPKSAIVDITNYMTYSFGHPMHAYDLKKIHPQIKILDLTAEEKIDALDNKQYILSKNSTVVANSTSKDFKEDKNSNEDVKIISLAGIIGAENSICDNKTTNIFLESAIFDPTQISLTARHLNINTDSKYRFERGVDYQLIDYALQYASKLMLEITGGNLGNIVTCVKSEYKKRFTILSLSKFRKISNLDIKEEEINNILIKLGFKITKQDNDIYQLEIPSWRNDIAIEVDIFEEIIRIYGTDHIPLVPIKSNKEVNKTINQQSKINFENIRHHLSSKGLNEIISWSFISSNKVDIFKFTQEKIVKILNPISQDLNIMRPSLLPNLLDNIKKNYTRNIFDISLYEIGRIYEGTTPNDQPYHISAIRTGNLYSRTHYSDNRPYDIYDIKADCLSVIDTIGFNTEKIMIDEQNISKYYHPTKSATLKIGKNIIGSFGEIHPQILTDLAIKGNVLAFNINLQELLQFIKRKKTKNNLNNYDISNFQAVERDLAFIVSKESRAIDIINTIYKTDMKLISNVSIFDIYEGSKLNNDQKSIAFSFTIKPLDKTLTTEEINNIMSQIIENVTSKHSACLRDF